MGAVMRTTVVASAICFCLVGLCQADNVKAAIRKSTNIPAEELGSALQTLAKDYDFQVLYRTEIVSNVRTQGAIGEFTPDDALKKLLSGTGLTYKYLDEKTVTIVSRDSSQAADSPRPNQSQMPSDPGNEASTKKEAGKKSSQDFRVAQVDQGKNSSGPSLGDRASNSQVNSNSPSTGLSEIVVTAQKREERLIDTPQSVTVLSADYLTKLGAVQFSDFANTVPGLNFQTAGAGYTQISLRGVTSGVENNPTVGIYVDDVPYGSSSAFAFGARYALDVGLFDLDRIEVLHGPQGTLYGASTMGGLIKYVTKKPDMTHFSGYAQAGVSDSYDGGVNYDSAFAINLPIVTDKAAVRASAYYSHAGGYIDNVAMGQKDVNRSGTYGGRVDLLIAPTDALTIRIGGFLQNISRDGQATADYTLAGVPRYGSLDQYRVFAEPFEQQFRLVYGKLAYDWGPVALTSISSYQTAQTHVFYDFSGQFIPILQQYYGLSYSAVGLPDDTTTNKFTQEVRFAATGTKTLEWLIGSFYTHESSVENEAWDLRNLAGQPMPNVLSIYSAPTLYEEYAAFGDLTYHLTSKFDVEGGIRYAHNHQAFTQNDDASLLFATVTPTRLSNEHVVTYLANARYHFKENLTGYLRYATGYRPGGPNYVFKNPATGLPAVPPTFQSDSLKSYEAGFKAETADRRFGIDLAGYDIEWSNIQLLGGLGGYVNAPGGARVQGSELTLTARPISTLTLLGAFGYQHAYLKEAAPLVHGAQGERLPNVPRFTAALNGDYEVTDAGWRPSIGATLRYISDRTAGYDNGSGVYLVQYHLPEYTTADLRSGVVLNSVNMQIFVHNLFDTRGQVSAATGRGPFAQVSILQPRTIGMSATIHF
jgi:iron complex outermembrane receptor protein